MLKKINRVKQLGLVFQNFTWDQAVPDFKNVNLIYGWNGCGKTTLTRLFDMLASGECGNTEFEIEDNAGHKLLQGQKTAFPVRVFNQDYVSCNISVERSAANTISILLGDENKELAEQVKQDTARLNGDGANIGLLAKITQEMQKQTQLANKTNRLFTDVARTISAAMAGSSAASRTYRAPNAKNDYEAIAQKDPLTEEKLEQHIDLLRQEVLQKIPELSGPLIEIEGTLSNSVSVLDDSASQAKTLCEQTVAAIAIDRLVDNPDIAEWVARGLDLHSKHESPVCEYCGNGVQVERLNELAGHFNKADRELKHRIGQVIANLRLTYSAFDHWRLPDQAQLYPELRKPYAAVQKQFDQIKSLLISEIESLEHTLKSKQLTTMSTISISEAPSISELNATLEKVNQVIREHNVNTAEFEKRQKAALAAIKGHYLSTIQEEVDANKTALQAGDVTLSAMRTEASETEKRLNETRALISSAHKACNVINDGLRSFLGHQELIFAPADGLDGDTGDSIHGYQILRHGKPADSLSEGEKTAIALIYFLVHLQDGQSPVSDTLVVVDDPISSLDSNSKYQAFSFLKNAVKDCRQVFVLTHNFDFLRLLLNWRSREQKKTGYYMLRNVVRDGRREALISSLDNTLQKYETEYLFLFKTLRQLQNADDETIKSAYPVPNMARKLWDTFIMFRVPTEGSTYSRTEILKKEGLDAQKLDAIYKFTNDQSHITGGGLDPALVPEAKKALSTIFEIMKLAAPRHFEHLEQSLEQ